jgi:hypothetical protein
LKVLYYLLDYQAGSLSSIRAIAIQHVTNLSLNPQHNITIIQ